jgi:hypothetical protein
METNVNLTFRGPCIGIYSYNKSQRVALFLKFIWWRTVHVSDRYTVHHEEYLNIVFTQRVFVMLVLLASASVVRMKLQFHTDFAVLTIPAWYSGSRGFCSGGGNRLPYDTFGFSVFLKNAASISDISVTDSFHNFPNSVFASDLLVSEITQLIQGLVYRLDDRDTEFRSPIRERNFFFSVASRSTGV